jgi:hypothetical protein
MLLTTRTRRAPLMVARRRAVPRCAAWWRSRRHGHRRGGVARQRLHTQHRRQRHRFAATRAAATRLAAGAYPAPRTLCAASWRPQPARHMTPVARALQAM